MPQQSSSNWLMLVAIPAICVGFLAASAAAQIGESVGKPEPPAEKPAAASDPAAKAAAPPTTADERRPRDTLAVVEKLPRWRMLLVSVTIFTLAVFVGLEVITKVPPTLHTPLMSGSNAISGITVVGAIIAASSSAMAGGTWDFGRWLAASAGALAAALAMTNVVGGFLVTHRMLGMFQARTKS